mgnify:CR=1 FL=1
MSAIPFDTVIRSLMWSQKDMKIHELPEGDVRGLGLQPVGMGAEEGEYV